MHPALTPEVEAVDPERAIAATYLAAKSASCPQSSCRTWTGRLDSDGFGRISRKLAATYGTFAAHRLAWLLQNGPLPPGTQLRHSCGNKLCLNPAHMVLRERQAVPGISGALLVSGYTIPANTTWSMQNVREDAYRPFRLSTVFRVPGYVVEAVRERAPRASRIILPCGEVRWELPEGITKVETAPVAEECPGDDYSPSDSCWDDDAAYSGSA